MTPNVNCPHCGHPWDRHNNNGVRAGSAARCQDCGCLWTDPAKAPKPPPPPSAREQLIANIENTIWAELERQSDGDMGPYVDRDMDMVDSSGAGLDMTAVAAAVAALFVDSRDDCSWCHSPCAILGWKQPPTTEESQ